jgi:hypothetical protein
MVEEITLLSKTENADAKRHDWRIDMEDPISNKLAIEN